MQITQRPCCQVSFALVIQWRLLQGSQSWVGCEGAAETVLQSFMADVVRMVGCLKQSPWPLLKVYKFDGNIERAMRPSCCELCKNSSTSICCQIRRH